MAHGDQSAIGLNRDAGYIAALYFRRQFLLGPASFSPTDSWRHFPLKHGLCLSAHPDLDVVVGSRGAVTIALLGLALDSLSPGSSALGIVQRLAGAGPEITTTVDATRPLCGRWIVICQNSDATYLFTDPFGFRQVYYYSDGTRTWCGSQPEIINAVAGLTADIDTATLQFLLSAAYSREESAWVGDKTIYAGCYHLMPNHYLDLKACAQVRFYPKPALSETTTSRIIDDAAGILDGTYTAISRLGNIAQALTAGWDSRVLLAASRPFAHKVQYFVDQMGILPEGDPDIWVPRRLGRKLGLSVAVRDSADDLPGWLVSLLAKNVTGARILPKSRMIYAQLTGGPEGLRINGNGSELCRNFYDKYHRVPDGRQLDSRALAALLGYKDISYAEREIAMWRASLFLLGGCGNEVLDMLYWEQRLGNWGAQYPAEQDIAVDEISPFCNRLLIETLLKAPRESRSAPEYTLYQELIKAMWPEVLSVPINPRNRLSMASVKRRLRPYLPNVVRKSLRFGRPR